MICASVNRFFTSDLHFRMIGLSTEVLLKMGGKSRSLELKSLPVWEVSVHGTPDQLTLARLYPAR